MKKLIFLHIYLHYCYIFKTNIEHSMASLGILRGVGEKKGPKRPLKLVKFLKIKQYFLQDLLVLPLGVLRVELLHDVHLHDVPLR